MYTLVDLFENTAREFDTRERLLSFWRWEIQGRNSTPWFIRRLVFRELNITGKDKHPADSSANSMSNRFPGGLRIAAESGSSLGELRLGRYQVLDEYGHSCDIRTWTDTIQSVLAEACPVWRQNPSEKSACQPRFRIDPVSCGCRRHHASRRLSTFTKQKLEDIRNKFELDVWDDLCGCSPLRDHSKPRIPDQSFRRWKKTDNKCWKTQSKKHAQWERHMRQVPEERGLSRDEEYGLVMFGTSCEMTDESEELLRRKAEYEQELLEYADLYDEFYDF